ncbi:Rab geranylgeranyltransferase [Microbotryomycetes sp. JL221]|nr:Rab geranylgeranyltransferase [Microbotryomycetes sp. JL221]
MASDIIHGVRRARAPPPTADSAALERKKQAKEQAKIDEFTSLSLQLQTKAQTQDYTSDTLALTSRVLLLNPEYQTGWSIRRRVLINGILPTMSNEDDKVKQLEQDVQLTNQALQYNPKNYSVWEHRKWCLQTMGTKANWKSELKMVELYLDKDGRNFHTWDYRRYLVSTLNALPRTEGVPRPTTESELTFTTKKISASFSNFSAWHYRTKLLNKLWQERGWDEKHEDRRRQVDQEFDLIKQAVWSDPNDQSAWLYHRWLVGKGDLEIVQREIAGIEELLEEEPDSRLCLDALVYYKRLLVSLLESDDETREERERLNVQCLEMLDKLQTVDPLRRNRYKDLALHIVPHRR